MVVGGTIDTAEQAFFFSGGAYGFFSRPGWRKTGTRTGAACRMGNDGEDSE